MNRDEYLESLREIIDDNGRISEYYLVTTELFKTEFVPQTEMDNSRIEDVYTKLREYFGYDGDEEVSMLEVIITLCLRTAHDIIGDEDPAHWFWLYFENWGMDELDDDSFNFSDFDYLIGRYCRMFKSNRSKGVDIYRAMLIYLSDNFV